jgi:hypothetical protein
MSSSTGNALGSRGLSPNQVEVRATVTGDSNLDGATDVADLGALASNYGITAGAVWAQGDFNYDGAVDVADLGALATSYGTNLNFTAAQPTAIVAAAAMSSRQAPPASSPFAQQRIVPDDDVDDLLQEAASR